MLEFRDLTHCRTALNQAEKEEFIAPDREYFDIVLVRGKTYKNITVVVCNTMDEPICILTLGNIIDKTTECYPFNMKLERILKAEGINIQTLEDSDSDRQIGHLDEFVLNEKFTIWNDSESYHLRNFDIKLSTELVAKLTKFGVKIMGQIKGLRLKRARWMPRRKVLRENAGHKRDFIMKLNLSNINIQINAESRDYFVIKLASCYKKTVDVIEPTVTLAELSNFEIQFSSAKWNLGDENLVTLLSLPKVFVKKNFTLKDSPLYHGYYYRFKTEEMTNEGEMKACCQVQGYKLQDIELQRFIKNFYLLIVVQNLKIVVPNSIQAVT